MSYSGIRLSREVPVAVLGSGRPGARKVGRPCAGDQLALHADRRRCLDGVSEASEGSERTLPQSEYVRRTQQPLDCFAGAGVAGLVALCGGGSPSLSGKVFSRGGEVQTSLSEHGGDPTSSVGIAVKCSGVT